jgi:hypothetical protein
VIVNVVDLVSRGLARYEWAWICSERRGHKLFIAVTRDAMKFDHLPMLSWHRDDDASVRGDYGIPIGFGSVEKGFSGVRLPASAYELQQIADIVGGMMLTPRVADLIWLQAGVQFDCVTESGPPHFRRFADVNVTAAHQLIEEQLAAHGDDGKKLVSCEGKYWCLVNELADGYTSTGPLLYGGRTACNYGWCAHKASGPGLTAGVKCWQRPGFKHSNDHFDPSQTIRLMYSQGWLVRPGRDGEPVDIGEVAANPELAFLLTHDSKPLRYRRQRNVPVRSLAPSYPTPPVTAEVPMVLMAPTVISEAPSA